MYCGRGARNVTSIRITCGDQRKIIDRKATGKHEGLSLVLWKKYEKIAHRFCCSKGKDLPAVSAMHDVGRPSKDADFPVLFVVKLT